MGRGGAATTFVGARRGAGGWDGEFRQTSVEGCESKSGFGREVRRHAQKRA